MINSDVKNEQAKDARIWVLEAYIAALIKALPQEVWESVHKEADVISASLLLHDPDNRMRQVTLDRIKARSE